MAGTSTIRGLVINRFGGGIVIYAEGGNIIEGNFIGTTSPDDCSGQWVGVLARRRSTPSEAEP